MCLKSKALFIAILIAALCALCACAGESGGMSSNASDASGQASPSAASSEALPVSDIVESSMADSSTSTSTSTEMPESSSGSSASSESDASDQAKALFKKLKIKKDMRKSFVHGDKGAKYQKYIVLHDTEGDGDAQGVIDYWDRSENGVAAHFVVNKDGSIMQCVPLDKIAHHAGFGDTGHNEEFGVEDESRDDKVGTTEIGDWASDYGMNSYSVGIEMVHVGGEGDYPEEQLEAVDGLIAYIDAYYGKESKIIDHKTWRTGNSDTSEEFADYLDNYQDHRTHSGVEDSEVLESKAAA